MIKFRLPLIVLAFVALAISIATFAQADNGDAALSATPTPVPTQRIKIQDSLTLPSSWPGTVTARRQSLLGFERGGLVANVYVDVGDTVSKGDKLASLNTTTLRADLAASKATSAQAKAARNIADATASRQQVLAKNGHISSQRLEEILANLAGSEAAFNAATAQAKAIEARLSLSHILAPYDGTITQRRLDEGAIAGPGTPVLELVESGQLEIKVGLPVAKALALQEGEQVTVSLSTGQVQAKMRRTTNVINPATQTVEVVFDLVDGGAIAVSGQTARVRLSDQLQQRGFLVPLSALREGRRGLWSLYELVKAKSGAGYILSPVPVEILHADESFAYVRGPIIDGAMIVRSASQTTALGMRVVPGDE
ncbi:hypothetical protein MNBD_ALPHA06-1253 [hydrothermal vent metagenome]|uniref:Uncharacterized protein n=1 Tax=hydrothermal vent metagenome TaxID=652676 RepID=A0A3B0S9Z1_9ZZZZ